MNNLEKSELVVAKILSWLMDTGFTRSELSFDDLELAKEYEEFFDLSAQWLLDEGIMRAADHALIMRGSGTLFSPVLTAYGLSLLNQPSPVGGNEGETVGTSVKSASESGASYTKFGEVLGGFLGGFTKSMGSG